jgi:hypothetical protein
LTAVLADASEIAHRAEASDSVAQTAADVQEAVRAVTRRVAECSQDLELAQAQARSIALSVARIYACASLCAQGGWATSNEDGMTALAARRLAQRGLVVPDAPDLRLAFG